MLRRAGWFSAAGSPSQRPMGDCGHPEAAWHRAGFDLGHPPLLRCRLPAIDALGRRTRAKRDRSLAHAADPRAIVRLEHRRQRREFDRVGRSFWSGRRGKPAGSGTRKYAVDQRHASRHLRYPGRPRWPTARPACLLGGRVVGFRWDHSGSSTMPGHSPPSRRHFRRC